MSKTYALEDLFTSDKAADYLGVSERFFQRRLAEGIEPVGKIHWYDLYSRDQLDAIKKQDPLPSIEWPVYAEGEMSEDSEWEEGGGYAYNYWKPSRAMTATGPEDCRKNAAAWLFVAEHWNELTLPDRRSE